MNKLQRSWILFKCSVSVVLKNKKLLVFPILSFVCTLVILAFVVTPVAFQRTGYRLGQGKHWKAVGQSLFIAKTVATGGDGASRSTKLTPKPLAVAIGASVYMLSMFLATFFNVAFFHQILQALRGGPVSIQGGLKFAVSRLMAIFLWSLFAGVIGLLIKTLEERMAAVGQIILRIIGLAWSLASVFVIPVLIVEPGCNPLAVLRKSASTLKKTWGESLVGYVGQIILRIIGLAWSLASVFVIPVLIVEPGCNPLAVLRKSASTLKKTWGESLAGYVGLQFGGVLVFVVSLVFLVGAAFLASALKSGMIMAVAAVLWLVGLLAFSYLTSVASQVYRCALYMYATDGNIPQPYSTEHLQMAWKTK